MHMLPPLVYDVEEANYGLPFSHIKYVNTVPNTPEADYTKSFLT